MTAHLSSPGGTFLIRYDRLTYIPHTLLLSHHRYVFDPVTMTAYVTRGSFENTRSPQEQSVDHTRLIEAQVETLLQDVSHNETKACEA